MYNEKKIHEQSLALARQLIEKDPSLRDWVVGKFPELRESEDERIRKQLISICDEWLGGGYSARPCLNDVKWLKNLLEKQKEHHIPWYDYQKSKEAGYTIVPNEEYEQLIKQKEQKPIIAVDSNELLKILPKPAEWDEENERMIDTIVSVLGQYIDYKAVSGTGSGYATPRYSKEIDFLKSLRPQPQGVFEQAVHDILKMCDDYQSKGAFAEDRARDFWGNVRVKCKDAIECSPILDEPHWKPSEEQMDALKELIDDANRAGWVTPGATELYEQLKKL